jgi:hypothetical protein
MKATAVAKEMLKAQIVDQGQSIRYISPVMLDSFHILSRTTNHTGANIDHKAA